jgi:hypothetical protein
VPDHSTFSKNRHGRFRDSDLLRRLFETVLQRCIDEGLVGGEGFAVDASLIQADASDRTRIEGAAGLPPDAAGRAVAEYLAALDDAAFGAASEVNIFSNKNSAEVWARGIRLTRCSTFILTERRRFSPKFIAPADPAARWTAAHRGPAFFAYSASYLIDTDNAIIVDVEATTAIRQAEVTAARRMIERSLECFDLYPAKPIGDTAYGTAEMLNWLVNERGIEPHIPVFDKSQRTDGTFSRDDFAYDHKRDCYICPAGKELRQRQKIYRTPRPLVDENGMMRYRASKLDCEGCLLKPRCCPSAPARKILRSIHEGARDMARNIANTGAYKTSRCQRKKVEMLFAHLKRILKLDRLRLRGPNGARDEFHLAATAQNLRKLAKVAPVAAPIPAR